MHYLVQVQLFQGYGEYKNEQVTLEFPFKAQLSTTSLFHSQKELQSYATQTGQLQPLGMKKSVYINAYVVSVGATAFHGVTAATNNDTHKQEVCNNIN